MFGSTFSSLAALALLGVAVAQQGVLTVIEPRADHWWIAESLNTLAFTGQSGAPSQFSVFLNHPDPNVLTSKYAIISIQQLYETSKTVNPGKMRPATGYTIELTDTLNSSNIYATSESFEIKAVGSPYPAQSYPTATRSVVAVSGAAASGTGTSPSQAAASPSQSGAAWQGALPATGLLGAAVLSGLGCLL